MVLFSWLGLWRKSRAAQSFLAGMAGFHPAVEWGNSRPMIQAAESGACSRNVIFGNNLALL
ncbi:MAG TPA: hypothetical protein VHY57_08200, partial [Rhizomicrobium sp.]|nr:hypothetical protein [Rhizomicrobium sp.]